MPFFTIVIPTYNRAQYLDKAIQSVVEQSFQNWELLVIDDCSTDNTEEVVSGFNDSRIEYVRNEQNIERSASRNKGVEMANGNYICFLDSDDYYLSNHLEVFHKTIEKSSEKKALFYAPFIRKYPDKEKSVNYRSKQDLTNVEYMIAIQVPPSCSCTHTEILDKHQFDTEIHVNEDVELFARISAEYPIVCTGKNTVVMVTHYENTLFVTKDIVDLYFGVFQKMLRHPKVSAAISRSFKKHHLAGLHRQKIKYHLEKGTTEKARKSLFMHLILEPFHSRNKSYLVLLLYNLPGGRILEKMVAGLKKLFGK